MFVVAFSYKKLSFYVEFSVDTVNTLDNDDVFAIIFV